MLKLWTSLVAVAAFAVGVSGCGVAFYGTALAIIATQKKTTTTQTSFPDSVPTADVVPGFATLSLSSAQVTVQRQQATTAGVTTTTTTVSLTDFQILGVNFPPGYGQSRSNRDAGQTLGAGDRIVIRVNGDNTQALTFDSSTAAVVGTQVAAAIQAKVRAITPTANTVTKEAYSLFTATYDPITGSYVFVSGAPGETSEVVFEPDPRPGVDTVKSDALSTATAQKLGLGVAQGGIETSGAESISLAVLNRGNDVIPQGTAIDLWLSHDKILDKTKALHFDRITTTSTVAVGEARRFTRRNGTAPPVTLLRGDITPGNYYVIFDVQPSNGEQATSTSQLQLTSSHPVAIYQPAQDPSVTTPVAVNALDLVPTSTLSPIGVVEGNNFTSTITVTNVGAPVAFITSSGTGVPMDLDVVLTPAQVLVEPASFLDPAKKLAGVRINPTDPNRQITVLVNANGTGVITANANGNTITVNYDASATTAGVATVQSLTNVLNGAGGAGLVDAFGDGSGSPSTDTLNGLLAAANSAKTVTGGIFAGTTSVVFPNVDRPLQTVSFTLTAQVRTTALLTTLLPVKLFPVFRIRPHFPSGSGNPENTVNNLRGASNYIRIYDAAKAHFDPNTSVLLPTVNSDDFAQLAAVSQRPVNTGSIRQGQQRVFAFTIPTTGLSFNESQLLLILRTTNFDAHVDLLTSTGDLLTGGEATTIPKSVVIYSPVTGGSVNPTFYAVVSPARADESDLAGGSETFDLTISVNPRQQTDLAPVAAVDAGNVLTQVKQRYLTGAPRTENDVLVPFSLAGGKAEVQFALPQRARVKFRSAPVFSTGVTTVITAFVAGQVPTPVPTQDALDETFNRIVYRPETGDIDNAHVLEQGVYTVAFTTNGDLPDTQGLRLEIDTQFIPPAPATH